MRVDQLGFFLTPSISQTANSFLMWSKSLIRPFMNMWRFKNKNMERIKDMALTPL